MRARPASSSAPTRSRSSPLVVVVIPVQGRPRPRAGSTGSRRAPRAGGATGVARRGAASTSSSRNAPGASVSTTWRVHTSCTTPSASRTPAAHSSRRPGAGAAIAISSPLIADFSPARRRRTDSMASESISSASVRRGLRVRRPPASARSQETHGDVEAAVPRHSGLLVSATGRSRSGSCRTKIAAAEAIDQGLRPRLARERRSSIGALRYPGAPAAPWPRTARGSPTRGRAGARRRAGGSSARPSVRARGRGRGSGRASRPRAAARASGPRRCRRRPSASSAGPASGTTRTSASRRAGTGAISAHARSGSSVTWRNVGPSGTITNPPVKPTRSASSRYAVVQLGVGVHRHHREPEARGAPRRGGHSAADEHRRVRFGRGLWV